MNTSDTTLHAQWCRERNADAFTELVYRHSAMVYSTCVRILRNASIAEEAAQDSFIELMNATRPIKPSVGGWLHTVAARRAVDKLRAESSLKAREAAYAVEKPISSPPVWEDVAPLIDDAIAQLPESCRPAVVLRFLEGKSHGAIADELTMSVATVRRRLDTGVEKLRKDLTGRGIVVGAGAFLALLEAAPASPMPATVVNTLGKRCLAMKSTTPAAGLAGTAGGIHFLKLAATTVSMLAVAVFGIYSIQSRNANPTNSATTTHPETTTASSEESHEAAPASSPTTESVTSPRPSGPVISGTVLDDSGAPVESAEVVFRELRGDTSGPRITTLSDVGGKYILTGLPVAERIILGAKKEGMLYMPTTEFQSALTPEGIEDVTLSLYNSASLEGRVLDSSRNAAAEVYVTAVYKDFKGYTPKETVRTDKAGNFKFPELFPGRHTISVIPHAQVRDELVDAEIVLGSREVRTGFEVLYPGEDAVIAGRVIDTSGNPIKGASVNVMWLPVSDYTDAEGKFRFLRLPSGEYRIDSWHEKHGKISVATEAGAQDIELVLPDASQYTLLGRVVDADSKEPITDFEAFVRPDEVEELTESELGFFKKFSDPDGKFAWEKVAPGIATVAVRAPGKLLKYTVVSPATAESESVEIALENSPVLRGIVTSENGVPVSGAYILQSEFPYILADRIAKGPASTERWFGRTAATQSKDDGTFILDSLIPNLKVLTAYHPEHGFRTVAVNPATIDASEISITLRPGAILTGKVTLGGEPLPGAMVTFKLPSDEGEPPQGGAQTEEDGTFKLAAVPAGNLQVSVRMNLPSQARRTPMNARTISLVKTAEWGKTTEFNVDFPATGTVLEGIVSIEGQAVAGGLVMLWWERSETEESASISVGSDGTYRFDDIPSGDVSIAVQGRLDPSAMRGRRATATLPTGEVNQLNFDLDGGTQVHGRVLGLLPEESGVSIRAYDQDIDLFGGDTLSIVSAQRAYGRMTDEGFYTLEGLMPGTYLLSISALRQNAAGHMIDSRRMESILTINESTGPTLESDLILD